MGGVSVYESGVSAGLRSSSRMTVDVGVYGAQRRAGQTGMVVQIFRPVVRLTLPVILLLTLGTACLLYCDMPVATSGGSMGRPLSLGFALVPLTFFAIHLTSRRYGAAAALGQVGAAWLLGLAGLPALLATMPWVPETRVVTGIGAGLFAGHLLAVAVFDGVRGPTWWKAPLFATVLGGLVLCLVGFPLAFAGTASPWPLEMLRYLEFNAAAAVALLVPYGLLRPFLPPTSGFGGY